MPLPHSIANARNQLRSSIDSTGPTGTLYRLSLSVSREPELLLVLFWGWRFTGCCGLGVLALEARAVRPLGFFVVVGCIMIQWSAAQTPSRARNRRRVGEAAAAGAPMPNTPILVDDDEDDVAFSSARAYAQAKNKARVDAHRSTRATPDLAVEASLEEGNRARGSAMEDHLLGIRLDPLEWRLGPGGGNVGTVEFSFQNQGIVTGRRGRPARSTIDLTTATLDLTTATPTSFRSAPLNEDCVVLHEYTKNPRKRKPVPEDPVLVVREVAPEPTPAPPPPPPPAAEEYRFKCAICMEDMKEETSTICGHIFCGACIKGAVQAQKKCPTCRKKLNMKNMHRIYL